MAEDERDLLDEMIALNQKHKKDHEHKKSYKIASIPVASPSRPSKPRVTQSPIGYPTQLNQNTMITLNNKNINKAS